MTDEAGSNSQGVQMNAKLSLQVLREGQHAKKIENAGCSHYIIENKDPISATTSYSHYVHENKRPIDFLLYA